MSSKVLVRTLALLISLASLAACTEMRGPDAVLTSTPAATGTTSTPDPAQSAVTVTSPPADTPVASSPPANPAVIALLDSANTDASAGRLPTATAAIERALRIEPRNPVLWQKLAMLKLQKGDYQQAEYLAARSNSWAGSNKPLLAKNWHIIGEARSLRGDNAGAKAALARSKALE